MKAMILAAGRGERMRPLTDHTPKPLLEVGGKPLIVWHIEKLVQAGITELVINHAHLGAQIEAALGDGSRYGAQIQYSRETSALETAGGIAYALTMLGNQPFAVINSDIYCDYDFARLPERAALLQANGDAAHLVLVDNPVHHPQGDFCLNDNRIIPFKAQNSIPDPQSSILHSETGAFIQKQRAHSATMFCGKTPAVLAPLFRGNALHSGIGDLSPCIPWENPCGLAASLLTFSGIGIYHPGLFSHIPSGSVAPLAPLLREQIALGRVSGEHHTGLWVDVGTPQRLLELDMQLRKEAHV